MLKRSKHWPTLALWAAAVLAVFGADNWRWS